MSSERQERIGVLAKQEYARRRMPAFLADLSKALNISFSEADVLSWEMSDNIKQGLRENIGKALKQKSRQHHLLLSREQSRLFHEELVSRLNGFGLDNVVLSLGRFDDMPLVQMNAVIVGSNFDKLWLLGDQVSICSADLSRGLMADWYPDDAEQSFEIASWGIS
jgi:hypothetical protein